MCAARAAVTLSQPGLHGTIQAFAYRLYTIHQLPGNPLYRWLTASGGHQLHRELIELHAKHWYHNDNENDPGTRTFDDHPF